MYQKTTLDNGLRILTAEMPHALSVSVAFFVGVGSRYEPKELGGACHYIEHMLFKGTQRRPTPKEISAAIEGVGGVMNADTGKERTVYWAKVARHQLGVAQDVLTDILLCSRFEPQEIEKERRVILEELNMLVDEPHEWVDVLCDQVMWGEHPLGRDVAGSKETVGRLSRQELLDFYQARYSPSAAVVSVVGAVSHDEVVSQVAQLLGRWCGQPPQDRPPPPDAQEAPRLRLQYKETEQAHLCLGARGLSYRDPDRFALNLLNVVLGEGMGSRLFLEIRERQGLAYDVHSYVSHFQDAGAAIIYAGVEPGRIEPTLEALLEELRKFRELVPEEELRRAKEFWKGRMLLALEDTRAIASWLGGQELLLGKVLTADEVVSIVDNLSAQDVQRVAQRCFVNQGLNLAIIGPYKNEERLSQLLSL